MDGVPPATLDRAAREALVLDTAERLFGARGVRAVGMDELIAATGLAKMTVYRLFATKDLLVAAYLQRRRGRLLGLVDADLERHADDPGAALLGIVDACAADVSREGFRGCHFNNVTAAFDDAAHPARVVATGYKRDLHDRLLTAALALDPDCGRELADALALVIDGMYLSAVALGPDGPARQGPLLARELLGRHASGGGR
jgi:AcrR family transcriptional regulator